MKINFHTTFIILLVIIIIYILFGEYPKSYNSTTDNTSNYNSFDKSKDIMQQYPVVEMPETKYNTYN